MTVGRVLRWLFLLVLLAAIALPGLTLLQVHLTAGRDQTPRADAIIVLGAAQFNGRPSGILGARLDHAAALFRDGVAPRIVTVGGGQPGDRFTEAESGRKYLTSHGVAARSVVAVGEGSDTLSSLQAAALVLRQRGWHSLVLVSDPWHMARCAAMAGDLGFATATSPTRTGPTAAPGFDDRRYLVRETGALVVYRLRHLLGQAP